MDAQRKLPLTVTRAANRAEAQAVQIQWHSSLHLPVLVTEAGRSTAYSYDSLGNLLSQTVTDATTGQARTWQWTYNAQALVASYTDPRGKVWTYGWDNAGNRVSVTDPMNRQTAFAYDAAGRVTSQTDPSGLVTTYGYDVRGRLTSTSRAGETISFAYTPTSQLASATLPNGYQITYTYDAAQRLVGASDNRGAGVQYTLDAMGNRVGEQVKDGNGNIALATTRVIDNLNRVAAVQGALGQTSSLEYDANGQLVATTDPLNQSTRQTLDGLGRTTSTVFADNASSSQVWNALDVLTQVTDPKGVKTQYDTNAFGEVVKETSPDIGFIAYQRDAAGNVTARTDARGNTAQIARDALGRVTSIRYADQTQSFAYDLQGNVSRIDDGSGSTVYVRDALGRVLAKTETVNDIAGTPSQYTVRYGYTNGDLTNIVYPSGLQVNYRRLAGRITDIDVQAPANASGKSKPAVALVTSLAYTALGQPRSWSWFNGDSASRSFDADGRMASNEFAGYTFDAASRITGITQNLWVNTGTGLSQMPITWTVGYDRRNRIANMTRTGQSVTFGYDANSNRLSRMEITTGEVDLQGQFDALGASLTTSETPNVDAGSNRLVGLSVFATTTNGAQSSTSSKQVSYAVDAAGNMTSDGLRTFVYDASNRLAKVEAVKNGDALGVEYLHNALGQRVFKSDAVVESTTSMDDRLDSGFIGWLKSNFGWMFSPGKNKSRLGLAFVYDEQGNLIAAYSNGSSTASTQQMEVIWLPLEDGSAIPVGVYKNGNLYAVHTDHLGTPRSITDAAKQPVWQWPYSAFGDNKPTGPLSTIQTTSTTGATSTQLKATTPTLNFSLRYPGLYCDDESQLCYNWWRSYRPFDAGFTQMDPAGLSAGPNRRIYAHHNALRYTDRSGLNAVAGAEAGAEIGSAFGPVGTVVGGLLGAGVGAWIGWNVAGPMLANHRKTLMTHLGRRPRASPGKRKASRIPKAVKIGCLIPTPAEGGRATDGKTIEGESGARPDRAAGRMAGRTGMFSGLTGVTPTFRRAQTLMT